MNILVTGGAGYVGSHAVRFLLGAGSKHNVWVYDNLSRGHRNAIANHLLIEGDLEDGEKLVHALRANRIEAVMHFAAFALVGESVADPAMYYRNNLVAAISLADAMRAADVKKIVFSSTTATYGVPRQLPIREDEPQLPINPYGFTKLAFERLLDDYACAYGWSYAALRYFNAAGASPQGDLGEDHDPETHLIPIVLQVALGQREAITIFGEDYPTPDGTCIRDYVHVNDLADAHLRALEMLRPGIRIKANLGTGIGYSVRDVINACRRVTGHTIPILVGERRPGDPPALVADASRARQLLGWAPKYTSIDEIVATAWRWHSGHPRGFDDHATDHH